MDLYTWRDIRGHMATHAIYHRPKGAETQIMWQDIIQRGIFLVN